MMLRRPLFRVVLALATIAVAAMALPVPQTTALGQATVDAPAPQDAPIAQPDAPHESGPVNTNLLEWQTDLALWTGVIFVVLMLVLWKFAWGPIADGLARREQGIAGQITEAQKANQDAQARLEEYERKLDAAGEQVRSMLADARRQAEQSGREIVEAARTEAKAEHQKALAEIDQAAADAVAALAAQSARMAVELAGKIVKTELKPADHAALVQQAVQNFSKPSEN